MALTAPFSHLVGDVGRVCAQVTVVIAIIGDSVIVAQPSRDIHRSEIGPSRQRRGLGSEDTVIGIAVRVVAVTALQGNRLTVARAPRTPGSCRASAHGMLGGDIARGDRAIRVSVHLSLFKAASPQPRIGNTLRGAQIDTRGHFGIG